MSEDERDFWTPGPLPPATDPEAGEPTALERRGESGVVVRGRALEEVLRQAYDAFRDG